MLSECESFKSNNATSGFLQSATDATTFAASAQCESAADAKCVGANAASDPECAQFCAQPGRESHPKCALAASSCSNPTFAQQNTQFCQCLQNPLSGGCSTAQFPSSLDSQIDKLSGNLNDLNGNESNDFLGNDSKGSNSAGSNPSGGGSGFSGANGSSSPIAGSDGSEDGQGSAQDKDILTGLSGGSGSSGAFFGYGSGSSQGSGSSYNGSSEKNSAGGIDLRSFLPGGKNDPQRAIAAQEAATGITRANGLSNFEKVTRKINQLIQAGELIP